MKKLSDNKKYSLLALLSALLLSVAYLEISGVLLLISFTPLLFISSKLGKTKRDFWRFFAFIAIALGVWSAVTTWWIWFAAPIGAILSVIITVVMMGSSFMMYHYISKRAPKSLAYTVLVGAWVSFEYFYTIGEISFPWIMLGNGFANDVALVQWYEYTGIFGGSIWVLISNIALWEAYSSGLKIKKIASVLIVFLPIVLSLVLWFGYKVEGEKYSVQVLQPNVDPYLEKFSLSPRAQSQNLVDLALQAPSDVDFIITPETSVDDRIWENNIDNVAAIKFFETNVIEHYPASTLVLGATTLRRYNGADRSQTARHIRDDDYYDIYNSAIVVDSCGVNDVHHKSKLVVGVEKMPFKKLTQYLEFLIVDLGGTTGQMGVDKVQKVFDNTHIKHSTAICYESVYGAYFSNFVLKGAEMMFIITNDGWWGNTSGYRQHFSFARIRAIESRRDIARSANTGISGFIDQKGRVIARSEWDERVSLNAELTANKKLTIYTRYGDYLARICVWAFLLSLLYFVAFTFKSKNHLL